MYSALQGYIDITHFKQTFSSSLPDEPFLKYREDGYSVSRMKT